MSTNKNSNKDHSLTSVKIPNELFEDFKVFGIRNKFSIQKLAERAMYLFCTDEEFRQQMLNTTDTYYTGSTEAK